MESVASKVISSLKSPRSLADLFLALPFTSGQLGKYKSKKSQPEGKNVLPG